MKSNQSRPHTRAHFIGAVLFVTVAASCAQCAPDRVGAGVARLTVRNMGAVTSLVNANTTCGFASDAVKSSPMVSGSVGSAGSLTFTVTGCVIELPADTEISRDCSSVVTTGSGKVTVSATRRVDGLLTGVAASPIIPSSADALTITFGKVSFENFEVKSSASTSSLTIKSGSIAGTVKPRLAVSKTSGACAIATPNVTFSGISYAEGSKVHVTGPTSFDADVNGSAFSAQNGLNKFSNTLQGTIRVWGTDTSVNGDLAGLDPEYSGEKFLASYECTADMVTPASYTCADLTPTLADGASRLSVSMFGTVVSMINANTSCGFSAPAVLGAATVDGTVGATGSVSFKTTACALTLPAQTELAADCSGAKTVVGGTVTVTGTKTVSGRLTGNASNPVAPNNDHPAVFELKLTFNNFKLGNTTSPNTLLAKSGTLSGTMSPRTALAAATGACSVSTPAIEVTDLTYDMAKLALSSPSGTFDLDVVASDLSATNGVWAETNALAGSMTIGTKKVSVPSDKKGLNPAFDATAFNSSWQCSPDLLKPVSYSCGFQAPLAQGVARLTPRNFGTVVSLIDANSMCGFSSPAVAGTPTFSGTLGRDDGEATFTITTGCTITLPANTLVATDCAGVTTKVGGTVVVTGTKKVHGFRTGNPLQPVVPTLRDAAEFNLTATFTDFVVNSSDSTGALTIKSGTLTGKLAPRLGIDKRSGACSISTPVATFSNIAYSAAQLRLVSDGSTFDVAVTASDLNAQNGTKDETHSNSIAGSITLDGTAIAIPVNPADTKLNPAFVQATFDTSYTCNPNLIVAPVEAACNFRQALGAGAARLMIKAAATATSMLDKNTSCGFAAASVLGAPTSVVGDPGNPGSITWAATGCVIGPVPASTTIATDCTGTQTKVGGKITATATKMVSGLRGASPPIIPTTRTAAQLTLTSLALEGFTAFDLPTGVANPTTYATVSGAAALTLGPVSGESSTSANVFSIGTPVAHLTGVSSATTSMSLFNSGSRFDLTLTAVSLEAWNGSFGGSSNSISGSLVVDGVPVTVGASPLVAGFTQAAFDATYVCTPGLKEVVPAN